MITCKDMVPGNLFVINFEDEKSIELILARERAQLPNTDFAVKLYCVRGFSKIGTTTGKIVTLSIIENQANNYLLSGTFQIIKSSLEKKNPLTVILK